IDAKPLRFRREIATSDADLLLLMDVLEHVEDAAGLLRTYLDKAPPQAQAVITVPAFQFLWSHHDVFLDPPLRSTLKTLSLVVALSGAFPLPLHNFSDTLF